MEETTKLNEIVTENRNLADAMLDGETVLWHETAKPFGFLDGADGKRAVRGLIRSVLIVAAFAAAYLLWAPRVETKILVILGVVLVVLIMSPFLRYRNLLKQTYFITNKRVFVFDGRDIIGAMPLDAIDATATFPRADGSGALAMGSLVVAEKEKQLRWRGCNAAVDETHPPEQANGLLFYSVAHVERALAALENAA